MPEIPGKAGNVPFVIFCRPSWSNCLRFLGQDMAIFFSNAEHYSLKCWKGSVKYKTSYLQNLEFRAILASSTYPYRKKSNLIY